MTTPQMMLPGDIVRVRGSGFTLRPDPEGISIGSSRAESWVHLKKHELLTVIAIGCYATQAFDNGHRWYFFLVNATSRYGWHVVQPKNPFNLFEKVS